MNFAMHKQERILNITILKLETLDQLIHQNLKCQFISKSESFEVLNQPKIEEKSIFCLNNSIKYIQIFPRISINSSNNYGSVCFDINIFEDISNGAFEQWFTIFDNPQDDLFDGSIGIDDEEKPRILLGIELHDCNQNNKTSGILKENNNIVNIANNMQRYLAIKTENPRKNTFSTNNVDKSSKENYHLDRGYNSTMPVKSFGGYENVKEAKNMNQTTSLDNQIFFNKSSIDQGLMTSKEIQSKAENINYFKECMEKIRSDHSLNNPENLVTSQKIILDQKDYFKYFQTSSSSIDSNYQLKDNQNQILDLSSIKNSVHNVVDTNNQALLKNQEAENYVYQPQFEEQSSRKKLLDENTILKTRISELEKEIENLKSNIRLNNKQFDETQIEITRKKNTIQNLEGIICDLKSQYQITKNLYTSELHSKIKNVEKSKEIIDKYQQTMIENSKLNEELEALRLKYNNDIELLKQQNESNKGADGVKLDHNENSQKNISCALAVLKDNGNNFKHEAYANQNDAIQALKEEFSKQREIKDGHIMRLYDELKIIKNDKINLENHIHALINSIGILKQENEYLKSLDLPTRLAKAEGIIQELESYKIQADEEINQSNMVWLCKIQPSIKDKLNEIHELKKHDKSAWHDVSQENLVDSGVISLRHELFVKNQIINELIQLNNDAVIKEKKLMETFNNQLEDLKKQNKNLENERDNMKCELTKTNENFMKLTNKYIQLTDMFANHNDSMLCINPPDSHRTLESKSLNSTTNIPRCNSQRETLNKKNTDQSFIKDNVENLEKLQKEDQSVKYIMDGVIPKSTKIKEIPNNNTKQKSFENASKSIDRKGRGFQPVLNNPTGLNIINSQIFKKDKKMHEKMII